MQAGLSALKTPQSYAANSSKEDPLTLQARLTLLSLLLLSCLLCGPSAQL
jgi:hypothetical protein